MSQFLRPTGTWAAWTSWKSPGTVANIDRDGKNAWSSPNNCKFNNSIYTSCSLNNTYGDWLRCTNFSFGTGDIPEGATIVGIEVGIDGIGEFAGESKDSAIYLRKTAGQIGDNGADATTYWPTTDTDTYAVHGGSEDDWNASLADADIRGSDFGVDISVLCEYAGVSFTAIDHVRVRVRFASTGDLAQDGGWESIPDNDILWDKLDELSPNDLDYAWHNAVDAGDYFEVALSDPGETPADGVSTVRWRLQRIGGSNGTQVKCELRQGAVVKASQEVAISDGLQALNFENSAEITDWTDLRLRFTIPSVTKKGDDVAVMWAEFEVPDAEGEPPVPTFKPQIIGPF